MAYYLQFDGSDDYVSLASAISVNWGLDAYVFEFTANIKTWPSTANAGIIGSITSSTTGITLRSFSPVNSLSVLSGGTPRYNSGADFVIIGEKHTYRLEHDANGDYRWLRDGVLFSSGNFTTSSPATVQAIGQARAPGLWTHMDLYRLTFVSGFSNNADYDPSLSGGSGTTLPDANGSNKGTLVNGGAFVSYGDPEPPAGTTYDAGGASAMLMSSAGGASVTASAGGASSVTLSASGGASLTAAAGGASAMVMTAQGGAEVGSEITAGGASAMTMTATGGATVTARAGGVSQFMFSASGGATLSAGAGGTSHATMPATGVASLVAAAGGISTMTMTAAGGGVVNEQVVTVNRVALPAAQLLTTMVLPPVAMLQSIGIHGQYNYRRTL